MSAVSLFEKAATHEETETDLNASDSAKDLAKILADLKNDHKAFKKVNKETFLTNKRFNKDIKAAREALLESMRNEGLVKFEHDGVEFELKEKCVPKHDMVVLRELLDAEGSGETAIESYLSKVGKEKLDIVTRRAKRPRIESDEGDEEEEEEA